MLIRDRLHGGLRFGLRFHQVVDLRQVMIEAVQRHGMVGLCVTQPTLGRLMAKQIGGMGHKFLLRPPDPA